MPSAQIDLSALMARFHDDQNAIGEFVAVDDNSIPEPYRSLLAHNHHMTVALESQHHSIVSVDILQSTTDHHWYAREIVLRRDSDRRVVQFGIVRLNLNLLSRPVVDEILAAKKPLGRILIEHEVLRQVKLLELFRIEPGPVLKKVFAAENPIVCFGRTAIIYCDAAPAIELLEVVCG